MTIVMISRLKVNIISINNLSVDPFLNALTLCLLITTIVVLTTFY